MTSGGSRQLDGADGGSRQSTPDAGQNLTDAGGIASSEAFGTAVITTGPVELTDAGGIGSGEVFGTAVITQPGGDQALSDAGGITSGEVFGTADITTGEVELTDVGGIGSGETFGTAVVANVGATQAITDAGAIASSEAIGAPVISLQMVQAPVWSGTGEPNDGVGDDGDLYDDTDTGTLYVKDDGSWGIQGGGSFANSTVTSAGGEISSEVFSRVLNLFPHTEVVNDDPSNMSRVMNENYDKLGEYVNEFGQDTSHPRDLAKMFGGIYLEGFISDNSAGVDIEHELGRVPFSVILSGNLDDNEGQVHAVDRTTAWSRTSVRVRSTVTGNYFIVVI